MSPRDGRQTKIARAATILAGALSLAVAIYALGLLAFGGSGELMTENSPVRYTVHYPVPVAIIPLIGSILLLAGLISQKTFLAWTGLVSLLIFSFLFLFSYGGILIPAAILLLVLLVISRAKSS